MTGPADDPAPRPRAATFSEESPPARLRHPVPAMPLTSILHVPWWDAYAADCAARPDGAPIGPLDEAWLALAGRLHARAQGDAFPAAFMARTAGPAGAETRALAQAHAALDRIEDDTTAAGDALRAVRTVAEAMERAGAFHLAAAVLRDAQLACAAGLDDAGEAALHWQRARAARQAGDLDAAADGYAAAVAHARRGEDHRTEARALLGAANVAGMRGNYPEARSRYAAALRLSAARPELESLARDAHQGLALAAVAARDLDAALAHAWLAFRASDDADERAHALLNAAEACRLAGEDAASLRAALQVLELATVPRLRMPALGTAAVVAARLDRRSLVQALRTRVPRESGAGPYEHAHTLVEFAEAWLGLAEPRRAGDDARAALAMAEPRGFHEVTIRGDAVLVAVADATTRVTTTARAAGTTSAPAPRWSREARTALAGIGSLPDTALALA